MRLLLKLVSREGRKGREERDTQGTPPAKRLLQPSMPLRAPRS